MTFVPGLELNRGFYADVVGPLLRDVPHAAARLGWGSDVLGFDTERSTDHGWGPTLWVFVAPDCVEETERAVVEGLPDTYRGWPVRYGWDARAVEHHVLVRPLAQWSIAQLGFDATERVDTLDWLVTPQQRILEVTRGAVFHDHDGALHAMRARLEWYPDDVWLWLLACQWRRVAQEEAFVGRTAEVGDDLGSQVLAARLARDLMRLWFLFARTYAPYAKWLGTAFARLPGAAPLGAHLSDALGARDYPSREAALVAAYELAAARHNALGFTAPVDPTVRDFHGRPFRVLLADRFADACVAALGESPLAGLALHGAIDQFADSTDVLSYPERAVRLRALYDWG